MRVLFDTNVILDFLLDRKPFSRFARNLVARVERGEIDGFLGATTVTTVHYLLTKNLGPEAALKALRQLLSLFAVAPVDGKVLHFALDVSLPDFEDAVLHEAARLTEVQVIVTRDRSGFQGAKLVVDSPEELEATLVARQS